MILKKVCHEFHRLAQIFMHQEYKNRFVKIRVIRGKKYLKT
jgi:hypothetical protein